jgi:hypothetical protein
MVFSGKNKETNQQKLIAALRGLTQSEKSDIQFGAITWDAEKPILRLKGLNGTPDFNITFDIDMCNPTRAHIVPECDPKRDMDFHMRYAYINRLNPDMLVALTKDIINACRVVIIRLTLNCYEANYNGDYGMIRLTPADKVQFLSDKSFEIDIDNITDITLEDCYLVPEFTAAILIETPDNIYFIPIEQIDRFSDELAERITKVRNKEPRLAS